MRFQDISSYLWEIGARLELSNGAKSRSREFFELSEKILTFEGIVSLEKIQQEDFFLEYSKEARESLQSLVKGEEPLLYQELLQNMETTPFALLKIVGIGAKSVQEIYNTLGIATWKELLESTKNGELLKVKGFGKKKTKEVQQKVQELLKNAEGTELAVLKPLAKSEKQTTTSIPSILQATTKKNRNSSREFFQDFLRSEGSQKGGMEFWKEGVRCKTTGKTYPFDGDFIDFLHQEETRFSATQSVMESGWYSRFYEPVFRPRLTRFITSRSVKEDIELSVELLDLQENTRVLDIGCGTGNYSRAIAKKIRPEKGWVVGLDLSVSMLRKAARFRDQENLHSLHFLRADAENLPFVDDSFDCVHCTAALHLFENPSLALKEFHRVLKNNGKLVVGTFLKSKWDVFSGIQSFAAQHLGFGWFERDELHPLLVQTGFELQEEYIDGLAITVLATKKT